jgi:hypothetical protein
LSGGEPAHDLEGLKRRVAGGAFVITQQARRDAYRLELDAGDVRDCILDLSTDDFFKSMKREKVPGQKQDVYHARYNGLELYVKLQARVEGPVVVVSFKLR